MTTDTTPGSPTGPEPAHTAFRVLAALADLGEATAAAIADHTRLGYSTVTPKLRAWETSGHAEKHRHTLTNQTLWRLTKAGRATTGAKTDDSSPPPDTAPPDSGREVPDVKVDPPADTPPSTDTETPQAPDVAYRPDVVSPTPEPTPPDAPPTEPDAHPTGPAIAPDEQPAPGQASSPPVPNPADATGSADLPPTGPADDSDDHTGVVHDSGEDTTAGSSNAAAARRPVAKGKRPAGALEAGVLAILHNRPDETFKVNDLRKLVDRADEGTGYPAASAGAISNALTKLTGRGAVDTVQEKPATFQAKRSDD